MLCVSCMQSAQSGVGLLHLNILNSLDGWLGEDMSRVEAKLTQPSSIQQLLVIFKRCAKLRDKTQVPVITLSSRTLLLCHDIRSHCAMVCHAVTWCDMLCCVMIRSHASYVLPVSSR
jgi:hypothetical protein